MNAAFGWCSNDSVDKRVINTSIKPGMFHLHKNRLGQIMYNVFIRSELQGGLATGCRYCAPLQYN